MLSVYVQLPYVGQPEELSGFCIILYMVSRRNCLLKHVIEGKIEEKVEGARRLGRRCKQLLDDVKEKRRYWKLKEEALWTLPKTDCGLTDCTWADPRIH